jgi:hypothetical protein
LWSLRANHKITAIDRMIRICQQNVASSDQHETLDIQSRVNSVLCLLRVSARSPIRSGFRNVEHRRRCRPPYRGPTNETMTALFVTISGSSPMAGKESTPGTLIVWVALPDGYHVFLLLVIESMRNGDIGEEDSSRTTALATPKRFRLQARRPQVTLKEMRKKQKIVFRRNRRCVFLGLIQMT